tara:strand:- start:246 stop:419 length:174 start_codon:yes stop_codon:yes gene_type:complete
MYDKQAVEEYYWEEANEQLPNGNKEEIEAKYEQLMEGAGSYGDLMADQEPEGEEQWD